MVPLKGFEPASFTIIMVWCSLFNVVTNHLVVLILFLYVRRTVVVGFDHAYLESIWPVRHTSILYVICTTSIIEITVVFWWILWSFLSPIVNWCDQVSQVISNYLSSNDNLPFKDSKMNGNQNDMTGVQNCFNQCGEVH